MKAIKVYVEGGGNTAAERSELRQGFDALFRTQKNSASAKRLGLSFVLCGSRDEAYKTFVNEYKRSVEDTVCILLVDSEDEISDEQEPTENPEDMAVKNARLSENSKARKDFLIRREPWNLKDVPSELIHLMVRCMEAWIVADPDALAVYYGKNFHRNKLPVSPNLESVSKPDIYAKLSSATKDTPKGSYAKIKHASKLLSRIVAEKVAKRCPRFATFASWIDEVIDNA